MPQANSILKSIAVTSLLALGLAACSDNGGPLPEEDARALEIAKNNIIVDTHIDVPYRIFDEYEDVSVSTGDSGQFDYPRAVAGGLNAAFMSIYTPAELEEQGLSKQRADELIDMMEGVVESTPGKFQIATSVAEVRDHFERGIVSLPLGMENGAPIEGDLANLEYFYNRGIRYITLAHSLSNHISDSSYDDNKRWGGLSPFGELVVAEMNRLGIMVDISHVSDEAFWDVMEITDVPAIASHSSARAFTPGFERNMNDDMIRRLAEEGGVIMINYGSAFLTEEANRYNQERADAFALYAEEQGVGPDDDAAEEAFEEQYARENSYPYATLDDVLDHIDHVVSIAGVEHVGIGSDYDGVGDTLPVGLKDVSTYPNLVEGLLNRGYSEEDIVLILGENLLRVWSEVEAYAAQQQESE